MDYLKEFLQINSWTRTTEWAPYMPFLSYDENKIGI